MSNVQQREREQLLVKAPRYSNKVYDKNYPLRPNGKGGASSINKNESSAASGGTYKSIVSSINQSSSTATAASSLNLAISKSSTMNKSNSISNANSINSSVRKNDNVINATTDTPGVNPDKGSTLVVAFVMMLLFQLGNRIFGRLQTYPMHNYPIFMNMLSVSIYIPICFAYIIPMIRYTSVITQEQRDIPNYKFAIMGGYDSLAGIMQTFAVNYITNSSTIVLVQQSAIPISMVISKIYLQAQYSASQYAGAVIVLLGIVVVLIPNFSSSPDSTGESNEMLWIFVLILSCIPMCLSSVYKEKALGETEIDVVYLNGMVAIFQLIFAIPLCIPSSEIINVPIRNILPNIYGGGLCWMGINTITSATATPGQVADDCSTAPFFVTTYLCFNVVYNILIVVILKHGSANILWMASTVIVPLSNVAFSLNIMPGHKPLKSFDIIGLCVIMVGLVVYRFMTQVLQFVSTICGFKSLIVEDTPDEKRAREIGNVKHMHNLLHATLSLLIYLHVRLYLYMSASIYVYI